MIRIEKWKTKKSRSPEERFPKYILERVKKGYKNTKYNNETFEKWLIRTKRI